MLRHGQVIQLCAIALLGIGVVMIHSAGMNMGRPTDAVDMLTSRTVLYAALSICVMMLASFVDVRVFFRARGAANPLFLFIIIALGLTAVTLVPGIGHRVNGASRWLKIGPLTFQPSELIKWTMVIAIAWWCARRRGVMHLFRDGLMPPMLLVAVACGLIVIQDLGTAVLVGMVAVLLLLSGGVRIVHMLAFVPAGLLAITAFIMTSPYRLRRLAAYLDPWAEADGSGYHPIQSMLAIAMGGPTGRGLGNGIQKFGYLPEDTTDFIFAVICEELGIAGAGLVVLLYLILLWAGMQVVKECRDLFGRLVALGTLITLGLQAAMNIAVVTVLVPTKGIALPLISSGGTGWMVTCAAIGLVAGIDRANALVADEDDADHAGRLHDLDDFPDDNLLAT